MNKDLTENEDDNTRSIKKDLLGMGFPDRVMGAVDFYMKYKKNDFEVWYIDKRTDDRIFYAADIKVNNGSYLGIKQVHVDFRPVITIPEITVKGIDLKELDHNMY